MKRFNGRLGYLVFSLLALSVLFPVLSMSSWNLKDKEGSILNSSTLESPVFPKDTPVPTQPMPITTPTTVINLEESECLISPVYAVDTVGRLMKLGEVAICGYGLSKTAVIGPSIEVAIEVGSIVKLHPISSK